jgi:hypothetical protein
MVALGRTAVVLMSLAAGFNVNCEPQKQDGAPSVKVYAYQRDVIGGIPGGGPGGPRPIRYLIYLETPRDATVAVEGVWIKGAYYSVETAAKTAPVKFESPVVLADESKNFAVPPTTNAVTEVVATSAVAGKTPDAATSTALRENEGALQMTYSGRATLVPIKKFERKDPLYLR